MAESVPTAPCKLRYEANGQRREFDLTTERVNIGRAEDSTLVLPPGTQGASRRHSTLLLEDGKWFLVDNASTNGTSLNGHRITRERLHNGDLFTIANIQFLFIDPAPRAMPTSDLININQRSINGSIFMDPADMGHLLADMAHQTDSSVKILLGDMHVQKVVDLDRKPKEQREVLRETPSVGRIDLGVEIFGQVGEALLSTSDLKGMLESILNLAFDNVPAEHGVILLYDEITSHVTPSCFKSLDPRPETRMQISRSIINEAMHSKQALLVTDAESDSRFAEAASVVALEISSAMCLPLICKQKVVGLLYVDTTSRDVPFNESHLDILSALALFSAVALEYARLKDEIAKEQRIRNKLSRYHSPAVVDQICAFAAGGASDEVMLAEEREVTIVFTDLAGFTAASEKLEPPDVVKMLNRLFARLAAAVFEYGGTLDKFMGDGMLAFFGAPLNQPDHRERAVRAALQMQADIAELNVGQPLDKQIRVRIGINSGPAVVGEMGSPERHDYTVIGDAVNLASRLESSVAAPGQIVLGPNLGIAVGHLFNLQRLPPCKVKGKEFPVEPWLVLGQPGIRASMDSTSGDC